MGEVRLRLAFSADGEHLAFGTADGEVTVCRTSDGKDELALPSVRLRVQSLAFGRTFVRRAPRPTGGIPGLQLAVGTSGGLLQLYDLEANAPGPTVREFSYLLRSRFKTVRRRWRVRVRRGGVLSAAGGRG